MLPQIIEVLFPENNIIIQNMIKVNKMIKSSNQNCLKKENKNGYDYE